SIEETAPVIPSVADALIVEEPAAPAAAADDAATAEATPDAAPARPTLADELRAGQQALDAFRPAEANAAFRRALALDADSAEARAGLAAVVRQQELLAALAEGTRAEAAGDLDAARAKYR